MKKGVNNAYRIYRHDKEVFQVSLKQGSDAERLFNELYPNLKRLSKSYEADFSYTKDGVTKYYELKTSFLNNPRNFYIEKYSNPSIFRLGGPFKAKEQGIDYFIIWLKKEGKIFWFNTIKLINKIEDLIKAQIIKEVKLNKEKVATGFIVPVTILQTVADKVDIVPVFNCSELRSLLTTFI